MAWIVMWWEGETRKHAAPVDSEEVANTQAQKLRARSDALGGASLQPIRVLPQAVWERMCKFDTAINREMECLHHVTARLCLPCVAGLVEKEHRHGTT